MKIIYLSNLLEPLSLRPSLHVAMNSNAANTTGKKDQGGQQTLEDHENPWIFFAPGKIPWKTLKLHSTPEK